MHHLLFDCAFINKPKLGKRSHMLLIASFVSYDIYFQATAQYINVTCILYEHKMNV
jgi:hypothetical protein